MFIAWFALHVGKGHVYVWGCGKALGRSKDVPRPRHLRLS